jgi:hypothetical protein
MEEHMGQTQEIHFYKAAHLATIVRAASYAASTNHDRPDLCGVCLIGRDGPFAVAVGTDETWVVSAEVYVEEAHQSMRLMVPMRLARQLLALIDDDNPTDDGASIYRDDTMAKIEIRHVGHIEWTFGAAEIRQPDTSGWWPTGAPGAQDRIVQNPNVLAKVGKVANMIAPRSIGVKLVLHGDRGAMTGTVIGESATAKILILPCEVDGEETDDEKYRQMTFQDWHGGTASSELDRHDDETDESIQEAVDTFVGACTDSGISSVEISSEGKTVTLNAGAADKRRRTLKHKKSVGSNRKWTKKAPGKAR